MKVVVIIPAAGLGTRMAPMPSAMDVKTKKAHPSKQFTELSGTPILIHTLRKFAAVDAVGEIWIALRENEIDGFRERLKAEAAAVRDKKVELVAVKEVLPLTGYIRGGVSPVGVRKPYPFYLDETAILFDAISVSAGVRGCQLVLAPDDLACITEATYCAIATATR